MAKGYWVATYRSISDPNALAAYAKLAGPALQQSGGRILVRGEPVKTYEAGLKLRTVVLEFDSVQHAQDAHDSPAYQEALRLLGKGAEISIDHERARMHVRSLVQQPRTSALFHNSRRREPAVR